MRRIVMSLLQIKINPGTPATWDPPNLAAYAGDNINWLNNDTKNHQPGPLGGPANAWIGYPILPGSTSAGVLSPGPNSPDKTQTYTLTYVCALDSSMAQGKITVSPKP